jgi:hypothetical protein
MSIEEYCLLLLPTAYYLAWFALPLKNDYLSFASASRIRFIASLKSFSEAA